MPPHEDIQMYEFFEILRDSSDRGRHKADKIPRGKWNKHESMIKKLSFDPARYVYPLFFHFSKQGKEEAWKAIEATAIK